MTTRTRWPTRDTSLLDAAIAYLDLGAFPIPVHGIQPSGACQCGQSDCKARGKHPVGSAWQRRAPKTLDEVREAFADHRGNLGLYLGGTPLVCLDFDGAEGLATLAKLEREGLITPTLRARSGGGGAHLLYSLRDWHDAATISDRKVGRAWDVKKSGQFLVAPSRHASGGVYDWTDERDIAPLPDGLYERIRKPMPTPRPVPSPMSNESSMAARARAYVAKMPPAIAGAAGHASTWSVARKLVQDFRLNDSDAWSLLCEFNARCEPPWSERELRHKLDGARRAHTTNPVVDRPPLAAPRRVPPSSATAAAVPSAPLTSAPTATVSVESDDWAAHLLWTETRTGKRKLKNVAVNVQRMLALHPAWRGRIRYDEFADRIVVGDPPWDHFTKPSSNDIGWTDEDATRLQSWMIAEWHQRGVSFEPTVNDCERAVDVIARTNAFHPVRDYLDKLTWDQDPRVSNFGATYLGTGTSDYLRGLFRWWLVSAIARVYQPGCKADLVLILEGDQGIGKSTALRTLGGEWFSDTPLDLNSKDRFSQVRGKWIIELAELDSLFRTDAARAKTFFSSPKDDYRPAYHRREREQVRQCVFAGSVNLREYLRDPTGNRRFGPARCTKIDTDALHRDRDQIWAEARWLYQNGAVWHPTGNEVDLAAEEQAERAEDDEWKTPIREYLRKTGNGETAMSDILGSALGLEKRDWTRACQTRVGYIMSELGFERVRRRFPDGSLGWVYRASATASAA